MPSGSEEYARLVRERAEILAALREQRDPRGIAERVDTSRATVNRATRELENAGLIEAVDGGYRVTAAGRVALDHHRRVAAERADLDAARPLLAQLPPDASLDPAVVIDGEVTVAPDETPFVPDQRLHEAIRAADRYRAALPAFEDPRHLRLLYEHVVTDDAPAELVVSSAVRDALVEEFPRRVAAMCESPSFELSVGDPPPYGLVVTDTAVTVVVHGDERGVIRNTTDAARRWAEDRYAAVSESASPETESLRQPDGGRVAHARRAAITTEASDSVAASDQSAASDSVAASDQSESSDSRASGGRSAADEGSGTGDEPATVDAAVTGDGLTTSDEPTTSDGPTAGGRTEPTRGGSETTHSTDAVRELSVPVALEREGFVGLSRAFFARRRVADPTTAWRAGLDLAEVHTGYAVERPHESGGSVADRLKEGLTDGTTHAVVGPPGSGKSTTLKRVACDWYATGRGAVVYREAGRGSAFESVAALVATADRPGHTLIIVEDAVRPAAAAVFEAAARLADRPDVSVLVDARESEWRDPPADVTVPEETHVVTMPALRTADCERVVDHVERTTGQRIDVSPERLRESVRAASGDSDTGSPHELVLLCHRVSALADPLADDPTTLEAEAERTVAELADAGEAAFDAGLVVNALTAAGLPVDRATLRAAVGDAADAAETALFDRVIFDRTADGYRTVHESWSVAFLEAVADRADGPDRFRRVCSRLLAVADCVDDEGATTDNASADDTTTDADESRSAGEIEPADPSVADRVIDDDPTAWADETVEAVFALARDRPKLAPLYGENLPGVSLPAACSFDWEPTLWLGQAFRAGGYYDRAVTAFERVREAASDDATDADDGTDAGGSVNAGDSAGDDEQHADDDEQHADDAETERVAARAALGRARVAHERSEYDRAERAVAACRETTDERLAVRAETLSARIAHGRGNHETARERARSARERAATAGVRVSEADASAVLGTLAMEEGEYETARERFEHAVTVAERAGDRRREADGHRSLGKLAWRRGRYDAAREAYERSLDIARALGDRREEAFVLNNLGILAVERGAYERAEEYVERSLESKRELGDTEGVANGLGNLGVIARRRGEYEAARDYYRRNLEIVGELGDPSSEATTLSNLGVVERILGEYETARRHYERSLELKSAVGDKPGEARTRNNLAVVARAVGDYEAAREQCERSLTLHRELDDQHGEASASTSLAEIALAEGATEEAADLLDRAHELASEVDAAVERAKAEIVRGRLALTRDEPERARRRAETAREVFVDAGERRHVACSRRLLGRVAAATGDRETARTHLEDAVETFEEIQARAETLATLEHLTAVTDGTARASWCDRARELREKLPAAVAGEWVDDRCAADE